MVRRCRGVRSGVLGVRSVCERVCSLYAAPATLVRAASLTSRHCGHHSPWPLSCRRDHHAQLRANK
jgi:hypothetical protein